MKRRDFITFVGGAVAGFLVAWPIVSRAQQTGKAKRIVLVTASSTTGMQARWTCLKEGLGRLGWIEGRTISIEQRSAEGKVEAYSGFAEEMIRLKPDLVVTGGTPAAQVMQRMIREIPVVFLMVSDPVASGIVKSLARPEANVTGFSNFLPATTGKLMEFIKTAVPRASRVAFLYDPANPGKLLELQELRVGAPAAGVTIEPRELRSAGDIETAFAAMAPSPPGALIIPSDSVTVGGMQRIVALAAKIRRPAIYQSREYVEAGGLMSYGLDVCQHFRRGANHVDKILKGAKPGDLPVEQPTTFEFVVNLKTARALGLKLPPSLLARADRVIE